MIDMAAHIRAVVDRAPPPSPEQIARIRLILLGSSAELKGEADANAA